VTLRRAAVPAYALLLTLVVTAPLLDSGYLLLRDAVSTPRSFLTDAALGLSQAAPRALPQDFLVALATHVLDGGVVVKALLIAGLWAAGWGAARLVDVALPEAGRAGQFVAATVAVWNPYVAERLLQGHWSLLVGCGALPWVAAAMLRLRAGQSGAPVWAALAFWIAVAGLTPTGLLLAVVMALVCAAAPGVGRLRHVLGALGLGALCALPWLVAAAVSDSLSAYDGSGAGTAAFAARAEPGLGTLGSLAGLGGIWNAQAVPASRTALFALVATAALVAVVALGVPAVVRRRTGVPLLVLAAVAVVLPAAAATGVGVAAVETLSEVVPGLGVLRDGQKWVALALPGYALAAAGAVLTVARWRVRPAASAAVFCLAVIAVLPDLAWGVGAKVRSVHYPPGWAAVAGHINADPRVVAVLPADAMRRFPWAGPAPVLDPLPRWVRAEVLTTGDLTIAGQLVRGEGGDARAVQDLLLSGAAPAELARRGVGWVVVEADSAGETGAAARTLDRLELVHDDPHLRLYRVGDAPEPQPDGRRGLLIAAHAVWSAVLCGGALGQLSGAQIRPLTRRPS
jgi:hypothetical protein